eukprot:6347404-Pyramimonas_sp.AAC.3
MHAPPNPSGWSTVAAAAMVTSLMVTSLMVTSLAASTGARLLASAGSGARALGLCRGRRFF